jgi:hypothetical protein
MYNEPINTTSQREMMKKKTFFPPSHLMLTFRLSSDYLSNTTNERTGERGSLECSSHQQCPGQQHQIVCAEEHELKIRPHFFHRALDIKL